MNGFLLCTAILCSIFLFTYAQDQTDDNVAMEKRFRQFAFAKRARNFAFAKRFDSLGHTFAFAKRSVDDDLVMPVESVDEQLSEPEKRARFAFAKRSRFAFAKRARSFAFA